MLAVQPPDRPCWAIPEGYDPCPVERPGHLAFVGNSSGAATREGSVLNAYQDAVERLSRHLLGMSDDPSPERRERIRARAYLKSGIYDRDLKHLDGDWTQQWEERSHEAMRVYYRAFALLVISDEEAKALLQ